MKRFALALLIGVNAFASGRHAPAPSPSPSISVSPSPVPSAGPGKVIFQPVEYYSTPAERTKIKAAEIKVNATIQSQCFRDFVSKRKMIQTNGRTPTSVADHLQGISGVVPVKMYYRHMGFLGTSAVAYRLPPSMEINLNRAAFAITLSDCKWAATLGHESVGHSLGGYDHDMDWSPARSFSVPYTIGGADTAQGGDAFTACCR